MMSLLISNIREKSHCNCPHANGKRIICKHQVALYFSVFPEEADQYYKEVIEYEEEEESAVKKNLIKGCRAADPFHLVSSFELLGYALNFSRLLTIKIEHILSVFINAHKIIMQCAFQPHNIDDRPIVAVKENHNAFCPKRRFFFFLVLFS